jgi:hypothetical protein
VKVDLRMDGRHAGDRRWQYVGRIEPKLAQLSELMTGGNRYAAVWRRQTATSYVC